MKKIVSLMLILLVIGLTLVGCKKPEKTTTTEAADTIKPLLTVVPSDVTIMFEDDYDLMTGVTATDNVDGDITGSVTIDQGSYNSQVPGQYVITYRVVDSSGNEQTETRNITVLEKMPAIVIDGEKYAMVYNPLLNPKFLMGSTYDLNDNYVENPWHFDLTKVSVFSKDYFDWLYTNYPDRLYAGWSNVAVTDADGVIVLLREHTCYQYTEDNGAEVCTDWSNGSQDNDYMNLHAGLANLSVPDGGHVVVFINDGLNQAGSPRSFGDQFTAGGIGLGKTITIQHPEVIVNHESNQLPIITVPEDDFIKNLLVGDSFDVMAGVSVTDNEDANVTLNTTIKKYDGSAYVVVDDVTTTESSIYIVEHSASYDGFREVVVRRQIVVKSEDEIEEKTITVGDETITVVVDTDQWPTYYNVVEAQLYTKAFWDTIDQSQLVNIGNGNMYQGGLLIVLDEFGTVVEIRDAITGTEFTATNPAGIAATLWDTSTPTKDLVVPDGGFVLAYWATKEDGYKTFVHTGGSSVGQGATNVNAIGTIVIGEWFPEIITVGDETITVVVDTDEWPTYYNITKAQLYTKAFWETIDQSQLVNIGNGNMYQHGLIIVLDENGKVIEIRDALTGTEFTATNPAGIAATSWDTSTPTNGLVVPDGGYVLAYWATKGDGYKTFIHTEGVDVGQGATDVNAVGTTVSGRWFDEIDVPHITVGDEEIFVVENPTDWANYYTVPGGHLYTKAFWITIDQSQLNGIGDGNFYQWSLLVVVDEFGKVLEIRDALTGTEFTEANPAGIAAATWTTQTPTNGLTVPDNGFVLAFTAVNGDNTWRTAGYKAFVHSSGDHKVAPGTTDVNAIGTVIEGEWFAEIVAPHITVGTEDIDVVENPTDWANYYTVPGGHLYTKAFWITIDQSQLNGIGDGNFYQWSLLVVVDEFGKVLEVRDALTGTEFTEANPAGIAAATWTTQTPTNGLTVPDNGFVLGFTAVNGDNTWRTAGYKAFVHSSGDHKVAPGTTDVNAIGTVIEGEWFAEIVAPHITVGTEDIDVVENPTDWATYYAVPGAHLYTKTFWETIDQSQLVNIGNGNLYQYSVIVVLDNTGKVVEVRDALAQSDTTLDLGFVFNETNPQGTAATWTRRTPTAGLVVPDGGYVLAFTTINSTDNTWRTAGYKAFIHSSGSHSVGLGTTDVNAVGTTVVLP